ncbi:MAG TPA: GAF domain-containing protein [Gemmatimonadaceae bacterium]
MTSDLMTATPAASVPFVSLDDVILHDELARRPGRAPNLQDENAAYIALSRQLESGPTAVLQSLIDAAVSLCDAGTAGVSLLETGSDGVPLFRWTALSGRLAAAVNGTTPRDFSPCGVCLDRRAPIHLVHPERYFTYFQSAGVPFCEALVIPFYVNGAPGGTIWIITHDNTRRFDMEDVRIMTRLATFTGLAYSAISRQPQC